MARPAAQQPTYPDPRALAAVLEKLSRLPPLVTSWEVESLKQHLAEALEGKRFILQGGDCAESFEECESSIIANKLKVLLQMSLVLIHGSRKKVTRLGRFAGQYAKPRSADVETRDGISLPSYRGDMINALPFTEKDRAPDPERLLRAYERSALTLNFIRSLTAGGFADLHHPEYWDLEFIAHSPQAAEYRRIVQSIGQSIDFLESVSGNTLDEIHRVDFFASHEGLHLPYEQAQTRRVPRREGWYDLATHLPWIGDRTRTIEGAHVEYFRGIANPVGVKLGPSITPEELIELLGVLDPANEPGKVMLVHRFGIQRIEKLLPPLIEAVRAAGRRALWISDPMHGNTESTSSGLKTRNFDSILAELQAAFDIHERLGSVLGGVHFELTGDNVTECIGGARGLKESDLTLAYKTQVDPRLNCEQALEMAFLISERMRGR
jgi:3-deoxy-7-phosphoheptulonate synthase